MAMHEFLRNIQTARNITLFHQTVELGRNPLSPVPHFNGLRKTIGAWLAPRIVADYDTSEFGFLPEEKHASLTAAVKGYLNVTEAIVGRDPSNDEMQQALDYLWAIVNTLDEELLDPEGRVLLEAICEASGKEPFPDFVWGIDYTLDTDWSGDPGIWIWVIVPDDQDPDSKEFEAFTNHFRKIVRLAVKQSKTNRIAYIRYRLVSEVTGVKSEEHV